MAKTFSDLSQLTKAILKELKGVADERQREVLMSFFKTGKGESGEGDKFLGVKVPQIRAIVKAHWAECTDADVDALITSISPSCVSTAKGTAGERSVKRRSLHMRSAWRVMSRRIRSSAAFQQRLTSEGLCIRLHDTAIDIPI